MMEKFNFIFGSENGETLLNSTENLIKKKRSQQLSTMKAQTIARNIYIYIYIYIYKTLWSLFMDGVQLPQG